LIIKRDLDPFFNTYFSVINSFQKKTIFFQTKGLLIKIEIVLGMYLCYFWYFCYWLLELVQLSVPGVFNQQKLISLSFFFL